MFKKNRYLFFILLIVWLVAELLVNPIGEFPLNDDFGYSHNVYFLVTEGRFDFSDWQAMTLIVQILWGGLVCKIFGFSFTALRLSTVLLGLLSSWAAYRLFDKYTNHKPLAFASSLLLVFNPFFFSLANTFMTDVPFLAVFLPGVYCFIRVLDEPDHPHLYRYWLGGIFFSILATLIRQPGLLLPLAFAGAFAIQKLKHISIKNILLALAPFLLTFAAMQLYMLWYQTIRELPPQYGKVSQLIEPFFNGTLNFKLAVRNNEIFFYLGLFALPLSIYLLPVYWKQTTRLHKILALLFTGGICSSFLFYNDFLPMGNVFHNLGLGPKTMYLPKLRGQTAQIDIMPYPRLSADLWQSLKLLGIASACLFVFEWLLASIRHFLQKRWSALLLFFIIASYHVFIILNPYYIDRYTLIVVPLYCMMILPAQLPVYKHNVVKIIAVIIFTGITLFSITATHDYLSWNRARWEAVDEALINRGVLPEKLLAGTESEGWYTRSELHPVPKVSQRDSSVHYVTFMGETCGSEIEKTYTFSRWLPPGTGQVFLQKEIPKDTLHYFYCDVETIDSTTMGLQSSDPGLSFKKQGIRDSTLAHSGRYSLRLNKEHRFAFSCHIDLVDPCQKIEASVWRKRSANTKPGWNRRPSVFVFSAEGFYHADEQLLRKNDEGWEQVRLIMHPQNLVTNSKKVKLNIWNISGEELWLDDFSVRVLTDQK